MQKSRSKSFPNNCSAIWPFICLLLIELITFGLNAKKIGVYQDEWIYFTELHFTPHTLFNLISTCFWDPRILVRPIEALHYGPVFYFCWEHPLWLHIICYFFEFLTACFLFLAFSRFSKDKTIALAIAALFLVYPTHDVTHYEIVASSLPISMALFSLSLWLYLKALDEQKYSINLYAALAYFASIYNYEFCLPFVLLYPLFYILHSQPEKYLPSKADLKSFTLYQIPFFIVAASMVFYRAWLLPHFGLGYRYATVYSLPHFVSVIWSGLLVNLSPQSIQFCLSLFANALSEGISLVQWLLVLIAAASVFIYLNLPKAEDKPSPTSLIRNKNLILIVTGLATLLLSYTIYGFSPEHVPVIDAWLNRVNVGGSFGACLCIIGLLGYAKESFSTIDWSIRNKIFAFVISALIGFLVVVDWQFAKPWIISWQAQKQLMTVLRQHAHEIKTGDSIIIGGIIRYASKWTPVVDGIWDFQGIIRTTLNNDKINGDVITERLMITDNALIDQYGNIRLGTFPFKQMILYAPDKNKWQRISSRGEFAEQANLLGWKIKGL